MATITRKTMLATELKKSTGRVLVYSAAMDAYVQVVKSELIEDLIFEIQEGRSEFTNPVQFIVAQDATLIG